MNGDKIRQAREAKGLTQQQLAEAAGIVQSLISALENGTRKSARLSTLQVLAAALDLSISDLLANSQSVEALLIPNSVPVTGAVA